LTVGSLALKNRIIMAPLTRSRAGESRIPNDRMRQYYRQRASAGPILSEATSVSAMGGAYAAPQGRWAEAQGESRRKSTRAAREDGGLIVLQLWHVGRISDPMFLDGETPVAPSAIRPAGHVSLVRPHRPFVTPRALETQEIPNIVEEFRRA